MRALLFLILAPACFGQAHIFDQIDTNRDGKVTPAELPEQARPFMALVDANGDGNLSKQEFERIAAVVRQLQGPAAGVETDERNIDYVGDGHERQRLDLYFPEKRPAEPLPVVVYIHGGAWTMGNKREGQRYAEAITGTGEFAVASINYRLVQDALWPAQIHDCKAAIRFLRANAEKYGIDPDRIAVMGSSAGGHLAALLGTSNGEKDLEGELGEFVETSSKVQAVVNFFGPTDFETFYGEGADIVEMSRKNGAIKLLGMEEDEIRKNARLASPVHWVGREDAPFLTAHGTSDRLVPFSQAEQLDAALDKAEVESHLIAMKGAGHGFQSAELNRRIKTFLDLHLRDVPGEISNEPIRVR
ncbi:alpha/beta hydrolase fold domain-containing protein [Haloferula helveola]